MDTRTETDSFGPIEVPADTYWGAQTQRSIRQFSVPAARADAFGDCIWTCACEARGCAGT